MSRWMLLAVPVLLAAGPASPDPVKGLAGRYYAQFSDGTVTGEKYTGENVVEIVPVAANAAYVRAHLDFFNGHQCDIAGIATSRGATLVYRDLDTPLPGEPACVLTVSHAGSSLKLDDGNRGCSTYCGARGNLTNMSVPFASRRPIRYMPRLKASEQYRRAMAEWRTGMPRS